MNDDERDDDDDDGPLTDSPSADWELTPRPRKRLVPVSRFQSSTSVILFVSPTRQER